MFGWLIPVISALGGVLGKVFGGKGGKGGGGGDMPGWLQAVLGLGGLGSSMAGTALSAEAREDAIRALQQTMDMYAGLGQAGYTRAGELFPVDYLGGVMGGGYQQTPEFQNILNAYMGGAAGPLDFMRSEYFHDKTGFEDALRNAAIAAGSMGGLMDPALEIAANRGRTAEGGALMGQGWDLFQGRGFENELVRQIGESLLSTGGFTPGMGGFRELLAPEVAAGGYTPEVSAALASVMGLLPGTTPGLESASQLGLGMLGGADILSPEQAAAMAREEALKQSREAAQAIARRAAARGQGPGAVTSNMENAINAEFGMQQSEAVASAVRDAIQRQQALSLQRAGLGEQAFTASQQIEAGRLNSLLNAISQLTQTATGRLGTSGQLGLGLEELGGANIGRATNLMDLFNRIRMGGAGIIGSELDRETQRLLGAIAQGGQLGAAQSGAFTGIGGAVQQNLRNMLGLGELMGQIPYQYLSGAASWLNPEWARQMQAATMLGGYGTNYLDFAGGMYGNIGPVVTQQAKFAEISPWGNMLKDWGATAMEQLGGPYGTGGGGTQTPQPIGGAPGWEPSEVWP